MTFKVIDKKTGKEADTYKIALKEEWAKGLVYCDIEGFALTEDGVLVLMDECGHVAYCPDDRFEVIVNEERPQGEFTDLERKVIADSINYLLGAELLEENGYTETVINALKSVLQKIGTVENHL